MSSFMRTIERGKLRNTMEKEGIHKPNKHLKTWYKAYCEKKHEYLEKLKYRGD